jgi:hypothetical protein
MTSAGRPDGGEVITRIELHNFMSHAETVIEPAAGLTVLIGPNNCGKSAVVSALQVLCENARGSDYVVRHGARECRVVVHTDEGHVIQWRRNGSSVSYTLDGEDIHRVGGGLPDGLQALLRLAKVEAADGREPYDIHFGLQKSPIFLINEPGSRSAMFFASSSDAAKLMAMQTVHRKKVVQAKNDESRLDEDVTHLAGQVGVLAPVEGIERAVAGAEDEYRCLVDLGRRLAELERDQSELLTRLDAAAGLEAIATALTPLQPPPSLANTAPLDDLVEATKRYSQAEATQASLSAALAALPQPPVMAGVAAAETLVNGISATIRTRNVNGGLLAALGSLTLPPELSDERALELLCERTESAERLEDCRADEASALSQLPAAPEIPPTAPLGQVIEGLIRAALELEATKWRLAPLVRLPLPPPQLDQRPLDELVKDLAAAELGLSLPDATCQRLSDLAAPPRLGDVAPLAEMIERVQSAERDVQEISAKLDTAEQGWKVAADDLRRWAQQTGVCPTCGGKLDPDKVVDSAGSWLGGHSHG